jgi:hypothetical protein
MDESRRSVNKGVAVAKEIGFCGRCLMRKGEEKDFTGFPERSVVDTD